MKKLLFNLSLLTYFLLQNSYSIEKVSNNKEREMMVLLFNGNKQKVVDKWSKNYFKRILNQCRSKDNYQEIDLEDITLELFEQLDSFIELSTAKITEILDSCKLLELVNLFKAADFLDFQVRFNWQELIINALQKKIVKTSAQSVLNDELLSALNNEKLSNLLLKKLWEQKDQPLVTLYDSAWVVKSAVLSPDGLSLLTISSDVQARLWDVQTRECVKKFEGHTGSLNALAMNSHGQYFVTGSDDATVRLWDIKKEKSVILQGHTDPITAVVFSPDGQNIATAARDQNIKIWNSKTGRCVQSFKNPNIFAQSMAFHQDGFLLATTSLAASCNGAVTLWNIKTGKIIRTLEIDEHSSLGPINFNADSSLLVAAVKESNSLQIWNVATGEKIKNFKAHADEIFSVIFNKDASLLVTASKDGTIKIWQTNTGNCLKTLKAESALARSVTISQDGLLLTTAEGNGVFRIFNFYGLLLDTQKRQFLSLPIEKALSFIKTGR